MDSMRKRLMEGDREKQEMQREHAEVVQVKDRQIRSAQMSLVSMIMKKNNNS
jgi:hypothetical protein